MTGNEFSRLSNSEGLEYRKKGDECSRIASLCFHDNDMAGYRNWRKKAEVWWKMANDLNHVYPDLEPPVGAS